MKKHLSSVTPSAMVTAFIAAAQLFLGGTVMAAELKEGAKAPQFELPGSDGETYKLADLTRQGQTVVVAWYPKAFTGG